MADQIQRIDIGFQGGQVLLLRMTQQVYDGLQKALGNERAARWYEVKTQDSELSIDLAQVVYVRLDTEAHKVGF